MPNAVFDATRRQFVKLAAAAAAPIPAAPLAPSPSATNGETQSARPQKADLAATGYPRRFSGEHLSRIAFPIGGIGTGGLELCGRGNLRSWQIFNRTLDHEIQPYIFSAIFVRSTGKPDFASFLESRLLPPFDIHDNGVRLYGLPGMPRLDDAEFWGSFPLARIDFKDAHCPVTVSLDAFSPFFPIDIDSSGLPAAVLTYSVINPLSVSVDVSIAWTFSNPSSNERSRVNELRTSASCKGTVMTQPSLAEDSARRGSFALCTLSNEDGAKSHLPMWTDLGGASAIDLFWDHFSMTGTLPSPPVDISKDAAAVASANIHHSIPAGATRTFRFLLTWHYPVRTAENMGWDPVKGHEKTVLGNHYCTRFADAWAVAEFVSANLPAMETQTRDFVANVRSSTLPETVKDAAASNLSTLVSNTLFRIADGSFHGFEGCGNNGGLGFGSCTHVWNYEMATPYLFPKISQSMRETSFGYVTDEHGHMDFRHKLPIGLEHWGNAAADGQMGQIVRLYLDWRTSGDTAWMKSHWPAAKRALTYAWREGSWDADQDGVMEGAQHNTYDVEFVGPNALCQVWYLAALRASARMAEAAGDEAFAAELTNMFERGRAWTDANLFNGEFYIQEIRAFLKGKIDPGTLSGGVDPSKPRFQLGGACHSDQLAGQQVAKIAGLGDLLSPENLRKTLTSIERYNYKPDLFSWRGSLRIYALNDEAAIVLCDYPRGGKPEVPVNYYNENWTGVEYSVSQLMCMYGMADRAIAHVADIRNRFDGKKRNPYDEPEYGHHYTRAMSSWGLIPTLSGFRHDAVSNELTIAPRWKAGDSFRCIWSAYNGWGYFTKSENFLEIVVLYGSLTLQSLVTYAEAGTAEWRAELAGKTLQAEMKKITTDEIANRWIHFADVLTISPGSSLRISIANRVKRS
jgi:uncharacterized protein (DUF608 family)